MKISLRGKSGVVKPPLSSAVALILADLDTVSSMFFYVEGPDSPRFINPVSTNMKSKNSEMSPAEKKRVGRGKKYINNRRTDQWRNRWMNWQTTLWSDRRMTVWRDRLINGRIDEWVIQVWMMTDEKTKDEKQTVVEGQSKFGYIFYNNIKKRKEKCSLRDEWKKMENSSNRLVKYV